MPRNGADDAGEGARSGPAGGGECAALSGGPGACDGQVPDDRNIVIERVRDELGDWRVCVLTPFGSRIHAPWAMAATAKIRANGGPDVETMWSEDGFVLRFPEADEAPDD
jgi:Lhr-like helicase